MWVLDSATQKIVSRNVTFVPGLYKIFDEILVNAADNKTRDASMNALRVTIDASNNTISVWNNGEFAARHDSSRTQDSKRGSSLVQGGDSDCVLAHAAHSYNFIAHLL